MFQCSLSPALSLLTAGTEKQHIELPDMETQCVQIKPFINCLKRDHLRSPPCFLKI